MKFVLLFIVLLGYIPLPVHGQGTEYSAYNFTLSASQPDITRSDNALDLYQSHLQVSRTGMMILGGWALLNLATGIVGRSQTSGEIRYFHEMNAAWNMVNLSIAGFSFLGLQNSDFISLAQSYNEAQHLDKLLLLNTGLDLAYIAAGGYLIESGLRKNKLRRTGYGKSLLLQGSFLLLFDLGLYSIHQSTTSGLLELLSSDSLSQSIQLGSSIFHHPLSENLPRVYSTVSITFHL